ncbi:proteasome ATPase [Brevibacterium sp. 50QC2O2]|uniref:proteasome ATPase n=1 Tax=Brevibacterium sp. 50QC2O2 TaxID=2968459 RepID=UPI00211CB68B|nr:proteasome ATPase [Brevibacterium sp. 50QC2O2]MCQ9388850.1 proteasome ATPase [Brevibacterium sp. 50QC2O2]
MSTEEELGRLRKDSASLRQQLFNAGKRNEALTKTLRTAREELTRIKSEAERLTEPPNSFATVVGVVTGEDAIPTVDILYAGRQMRVAISPELDSSRLVPGITVRLSEGLVALDVADYNRVGTVVTVRELVGEDRILVGAPGDDEQIYTLAQPLLDSGLRAGTAVLVDTRTHYAYELVEKPEVQSLLLEHVPDISYTDIGGLHAQIGEIQDAVELPFEHPELYREHGLKPPKGILLYGPPGCGKTLIAKAVANSLAARRQADPEAAGRRPRSYFLNIKGPELLDKYVGETERQLRLIFARAREKATAGSPVVVFFDEMESLFRTRGTGKSSDVETTIVPQLLAEIDGVERLDNVIVIGASNREDLIDPAILRPGRLDVKIRIERPDRQAAKEIFGIYLNAELPLHPSVLEGTTDRQQAVDRLIDHCTERMYERTPENEFVRVTYATGRSETMYFADFTSGAMIANIIDRAKKYAIKDALTTGVKGLSAAHFDAAIAEEFSEHEDLPNETNPDEWARISGKKGERITNLTMLARDRREIAAASAAAATVPPAVTARPDDSLL